MIILLNDSGQLGNRLRSLSNLIALGLETKQTVICPTVPEEVFHYMNMEFASIRPIKVHFSNSAILSLVSKIIGKTHINDKGNWPDKRINIYTNWINFAEPELTYKHYEVIANYFGFKHEFVEQCRKLLPPKSRDEEIYVGVHLRRKDYRFWRDGKYYFEEQVFMDQMLSIYKENNNIKFLIFTNDQIDKSAFDLYKLPVHYMNGSAYEDLCAMSMCDYIFGPPSTFSAWAGFIGNKRLAWLKDKNVKLRLKDFQSVPLSMETTKAFWHF